MYMTYAYMHSYVVPDAFRRMLWSSTGKHMRRSLTSSLAAFATQIATHLHTHAGAHEECDNDDDVMMVMVP